MKKIFLILSAFIFALSSGISAYASSFSENALNNAVDSAKNLLEFKKNVSEMKRNKYGVIKYQDFLKLHDGSYNVEEQNAKYNGKWVSNFYDPKIKFGGTVCDPATQRAVSRFSSDGQGGDILRKACKKWLNPDSKNQIFIFQRSSLSDTISGTYYFLESDEDSEDFEVKIGRDNMFMFESKKQDIGIYNVFFQIHGAGCYYWDLHENDCNFHNGNIIIYTNKNNLGQNHRFNQEKGDYEYFYETHFFGNFHGGDYIPMFNTFKTIYPEDFPEEDKPARSRPVPENEAPKLKDWYPRPTFTLKNKHLDAMIFNVDTETKKTALDIAHTQPSFSIYDSKKEREIFTYHGSKLTDHFIYDFDEYGTYYLKTTVHQPPPFVLGENKYKIHQPVWTEILVDGGSYVFFPDGSESVPSCKGTECGVPEYAKVCSARFEDLGGAVGCEFNKLNQFMKGKLGLLWSPVDILGRTASNFTRNQPVSCSVNHGVLRVDACIVQRKLPQIYTFLNMVANGVLLFGFVLFVKNQLSGFVSERGGE